jgi:hypothetical protein
MIKSIGMFTHQNSFIFENFRHDIGEHLGKKQKQAGIWFA